MMKVSELVYNAIEVSASVAAFDAFATEHRGALGRNLTEPTDQLDAARARVGGPGHRQTSFFHSLSTPDLQLLTVLYLAARDWRGNIEREESDDSESAVISDESLLDPEKEVRENLQVTRQGNERATREFCLHKLLGVAGNVRVNGLVEGLRRFGAVAAGMRDEFATF